MTFGTIGGLRTAFLGCLGLVASALMPQGARAVDINAGDYTPAPAGTTAALFYTTYTQRGSYVLRDGTEVAGDTGLDSLVGILRFVHYMDVGGITVAPQVLLPFGKLSNGSLGGVSLASAHGFGDPIFAAPAWVVNRKDSGTSVVVVPYLFVPLGAYDAGEALNLGENRVKFDLQLGFSQRLGSGFTLEGAYDILWYGDNDDAVGRGRGTLEQDSTKQAQLWLSYAPKPDSPWSYAVGYSSTSGGEQRLDGASTGSATRADQVRLQASRFFAPDFQVQATLQRDIKVEGGFKEDARATLRLMKLF